MNNTRPLGGASSAALNAKAGALSTRAIGGKKRTRDERDAPGACNSIRIRSHTSEPGSDLELLPLTLISRTQLPLVHLDVNPDGIDTYPRLFRGRLSALESRVHSVTSVHNERADAKILLTQDTASSRLFAVEVVKPNVYALCRLRKGLSLKDFAAPRELSHVQFVDLETGTEQWWTPVAPPSLHRLETDTGPHSVRKAFSMQPRVQTSVAQDITEKVPDPPSKDVQTEPPVQLDGLSSNDNALGDQDKVSPEELQSAIRSHYLDSLYINRTPLAYFAKGPLSRARAAVKDDAAQLKQLIEFLRNHTMSLNTGGKKYDATLAELIREIPGGLSVEEMEASASMPLHDRIRKSRKRKQMSKAGLFAGEEEYVVRWWIKREESLLLTGSDDTRDTRIKSGLADLRAREMQLQIVLVLEILALEVTAEEQPEPVQTSEASTTTAKKRKPVDLKNLLDVLIDRLCIWESMHFDSPQKTKSQPTEASKKGQNTQDTDSDRLKDFCTEVVMPYYSTRLPDLYVSLCQKLGGPTLASPPAMKTPARKKQKPGAAVSRAAVGRNKGGEAGVKRPHGPLSRSATDSQLPALKRELSETSLANVPRHRPTLQQSHRFSQREVDLTSITAATETKLAKKAAADRELKNAIAALRRPNARLAVKDYVDSNEQRKAAQSSKGRKAKAPMRNPFATADTAVQVSATPKASRQRVPYTLPLPPQQHVINLSEDQDVIPPSSDPRIPSSSIKPAYRSQPHPPGLLGETPQRDSITDTVTKRPRPVVDVDVDATPSRKRAKVVPARRPTVSLSAVPEIVLPEDSHGSSQSRLDSSPRLPALPIEERSAFFNTPIKAVRFGTLAPGVAGCGGVVYMDPQRHGAAEAMLIGDTPAKPSAPVPAPLQQYTPERAVTGTAMARLNDGLSGRGSSDDQAARPAALSFPAPNSEVIEPAKATKVPAGAEIDIYAALGWDDEDDLGF